MGWDGLGGVGRWAGWLDNPFLPLLLGQFGSEVGGRVSWGVIGVEWDIVLKKERVDWRGFRNFLTRESIDIMIITPCQTVL